MTGSILCICVWGFGGEKKYLFWGGERGGAGVNYHIQYLLGLSWFMSETIFKILTFSNWPLIKDKQHIFVIIQWILGSCLTRWFVVRSWLMFVGWKRRLRVVLLLFFSYKKYFCSKRWVFNESTHLNLNVGQTTFYFSLKGSSVFIMSGWLYQRLWPPHL